MRGRPEERDFIELLFGIQSCVVFLWTTTCVALARLPIKTLFILSQNIRRGGCAIRVSDPSLRQYIRD